jgi:hypothetical protein
MMESAVMLTMLLILGGMALMVLAALAWIVGTSDNYIEAHAASMPYANRDSCDPTPDPVELTYSDRR